MYDYRIRYPSTITEVIPMFQPRLRPSLILMSFMLSLVTLTGANAEEDADPFENLAPVEDAKVGMAYIDPDADFSVFKRFMILEPHVAFRSNWERDQRRTGSRTRVSASDMDRIKTDVANLFRDVFTETLEKGDAMQLAEEPDFDVLLIRPAIIDLDITAPDLASPGRSRTFTTTGGAATLYIELYDSVSGQIIGRALDRRTVRNSTGNVSWTNRVTNTADARRMFMGWAELLRNFLESYYSE